MHPCDHRIPEKSYESAVSIIDSRRRRDRPQSTISSKRSAVTAASPNGRPDLRGIPSLVGMSEWLRMLGHSDHNINALNVIHIAGTKGKGSTCAFTEAMLRSHGHRTGYPRKTGLYTSPHLINPEERIRINSKPLDRDSFAKYFFEIYDCLPQLATEYDPKKEVIDRGPRYLQLYALFAFHVFIRESVDAVIIETHNGGEYDATNVVKQPLVTAVTTLGMDHIDMLGPTIENIAWHKSGIYKAGAAALSTAQESAPARVLEERALSIGEKIRFIGIDTRLPQDTLATKPSVQKTNASLAAAAVQAFLDKAVVGGHVKAQLSVEDIEAGVKQFVWPGRFQVVPDGRCTWFLDAAHNDMSMTVAAQWFAEAGATVTEGKQNTERILIFSHINQLRDTAALLEQLARALKDSEVALKHVIFSTYDECEQRTATDKPTNSQLFHETWKKVFPDTQIWDEPTIQRAMNLARGFGDDLTERQILITGSQHLVGPALRLLESSGLNV